MDNAPTDPAEEQTPITDEETNLAEGEHSEEAGAAESEPGKTASEKNADCKKPGRAFSRSSAPRGIPRRPKRPRKRRGILRLEQEKGSLEMTEAVIARIVHEEARNENVLEIRGKGLVNKLRKMFAPGRIVDGVYLEQHSGSLALEVTIAVRYGVNVPALAREIRTKISEKVEHVTGCKVEAVNVIVDRIVMRKT